MTNLKSIVALLLMMLSVLADAGGIGSDKLPSVNSIARHDSGVGQYFAATDGGLFVSDDGLVWRPAIDTQLPVTMVAETGGGTLYAFVLGQGLIKLVDSTGTWQVINNRFGSQVLLDLSSDAKTPGRLLGLNQFRKIVISENDGTDWHRISGEYQPRTPAQRRGQALFVETCQGCHGIDGVGETYNMQSLTNKKYIRAPALDASEHAWHHTDEALMKTILEGSPRGTRMIAWKDAGVSEQDATNLVAYIKSLWGARELACQGPKHMQCRK